MDLTENGVLVWWNRLAIRTGLFVFDLTRGYLLIAVGKERSDVERRELYWMWGAPERREFWCTLFRRRSEAYGTA